MFDTFKEMHKGFHEHREHCGHDGETRHRHRHGPFGERWEGFGFGGGRGERFFDNGHLRLVILQLIADKPSYGYEIIKAIEERLAGSYTPSPGVVYPTLTLLEEEGLATVASTEGNKKLYTATQEGLEHLKSNQPLLKAIFGRIEHVGRAFGRRRSPQIMRAMANLMLALKMRAGRGDLKPEQVSRIAEAVDAAARAIDEV